jgi:hypothetical protein
VLHAPSVAMKYKSYALTSHETDAKPLRAPAVQLLHVPPIDYLCRFTSARPHQFKAF